MSGILACAVAAATAVVLHDVSVSPTVVHPSTATGTFLIGGGNTTSGGLPTYQWLLYGAPGSYEVRATQQSASGAVASGDTQGVWLSLSSGRRFIYSNSSVGIGSASLLIEVRPVSGTVIASCTITYACEVD